MIGFFNSTSGKWEFWQNPTENFEFALADGNGDYTVFTSDIRNIYYKSNSESGLQTIQVCPMNERYVIEDDDNGDPDWT